MLSYDHDNGDRIRRHRRRLSAANRRRCLASRRARAASSAGPQTSTVNSGSRSRRSSTARRTAAASPGPTRAARPRPHRRREDERNAEFFYELTLTPGPAPQRLGAQFHGRKVPRNRHQDLARQKQRRRPAPAPNRRRCRRRRAGLAQPARNHLQGQERHPALLETRRRNVRHADVEDFQAQLDLLANCPQFNRQTNIE